MFRKRIAAAVMVCTMAATLLPGPARTGQVYAASGVGSLNGKSYSSYKSLVKDLESDYKNKSVTIEMNANWNGAGDDGVYDNNIVIPSGCTATLNMHGYVINRNRAFRNDSNKNGEVICMESGSSLTVNGGTGEGKNRSHPHVMTYSSTNSSNKASKDTTTYGGTLTGGCGSYGSGGVQVKEKCTLTLNEVTIAGCGTRGTGTYGGLGGGIYMKQGGATVRLNNSTIRGCFADVDGGAIYANGEPETIELNNSVLDRNYAEEDGGGIYTNNQKVSITGRNGSKVINNEANGYGGGVCVWYGESSVGGLEISGNKAKNGGGVHMDSQKISLSGLIIKNNTAERGGGVYNTKDKDKNTIGSCEITGNHARMSGGGVYVGEDVDEGFTVSGKTIIKDNKGDYFSRSDNLYFSDDTPTDNRCDFKLTKGSDVHVGYCDTKNKDSIMVTYGKANDKNKGTNCIQFLTADNSGYHFTYNSAANQRKIYYVKNGKDSSGTGEPAQKAPDPTAVTPDNAVMNDPESAGSPTKAGKVGTVGAGSAGSMGDHSGAAPQTT